MPIIFISLNHVFTTLIKAHGYEAHVMKIQDFKPTQKKTYYVSPANSLGFMDGGIDLALSREVFPGIESKVKAAIRATNNQNLLGRYYLPIGSSLVVEHDPSKALVVAPTMLLPQDVSKTRNAYYATIATLYNILVNRKESLTECDIIFTSFCCGYGKMSEEESVKQILQGINDYVNYVPDVITSTLVFAEPNLLTQPKLYQNTEWFPIRPEDFAR